VDAAVASMLTLNRDASLALRAVPSVRACTDVTGFGLLGHAAEMAERSGVALRIGAGSVPLLPGADRYAAGGAVAGGLGRNRRYFEAHAGGIALDPAVDPTLATLLFDPQTSGGLLFTVPDEDADTSSRRSPAAVPTSGRSAAPSRARASWLTPESSVHPLAALPDPIARLPTSQREWTALMAGAWDPAEQGAGPKLPVRARHRPEDGPRGGVRPDDTVLEVGPGWAS
jgi:hypothetical protein